MTLKFWNSLVSQLMQNIQLCVKLFPEIFTRLQHFIVKCNSQYCNELILEVL